MQQTLKNRTIFCRDNLEVLRGINSKTIDLIYLDPPFNSNKKFTAPIDSTAEGASFKDIFRKEDIKNEWLDIIREAYGSLAEYLKGIEQVGVRYNKYYLVYMAIRLIELHRILKDTGSIYFHCDPKMSHYVKLLLDSLFGESCFKNELIWYYSGGGASKRYWARKHDVILYYTKSREWTFNVDEVRSTYKWDQGQKRADGSARDLKKGKIPDDVFIMHSILPWQEESVGYPTQKPVDLLVRMIKASSNQGDIVLDPFCGCATTCVAAEKLGRKWLGIDVSRKAYELVRKRLSKEIEGKGTFFFHEIIYREDLPVRTDTLQNKLTKTEIKTKLFGEQQGKCKGCRTLFEYRHFHLDHIIPVAKGGGDNVDNLQLLCGSCNNIKGDRSMEYLKNRLKEIQ